MRDVLVEVLQILEFVHGKSVIHRDISPDNIIRRRSDQKLVLVDFGAAKHATATLLAKTGTGIGKPSYGAPEQMLGKSVFQSDLFGLGVTCLHLLTNVEPFTLYDVLENEYQWRQFLNGKVVSDEFGKLLDRMTAYRVKERPNSVIEILQVLGITRKIFNTVSTSSSVYSFKSADLPFEHRFSVISVKSQQNNHQANIRYPIEYSNLERLLKAKEWRQADVMTGIIMLKATNRQREGWLDATNIQNFPCSDLLTIDRLWSHYSNHRFGFSVQKNLWLQYGGQIGVYKSEIWEKFATKLGWYSIKSNKWLTYDEFMKNTRDGNDALLASLPMNYAIPKNSTEGNFISPDSIESITKVISRCNR